MANRIIRGPTACIKDVDYPLPDVIAEIAIMIEDDTDNKDDANAGLIELYAVSTEVQRALIDETLTWVCGYSLPTILLGAAADEDLLTALDLKGKLL